MTESPVHKDHKQQQSKGTVMHAWASQTLIMCSEVRCHRVPAATAASATCSLACGEDSSRRCTSRVHTTSTGGRACIILLPNMPDVVHMSKRGCTLWQETTFTSVCSVVVLWQHRRPLTLCRFPIRPKTLFSILSHLRHCDPMLLVVNSTERPRASVQVSG